MNDILSNVKRELKYNLGVEGHEIVNEEVDILDEDVSASAEAIESVEDNTEVNDLSDDADGLQDTLETGDELITAVESAIATGRGLTPFESVALKSVVKQITGKYSQAPVELLPAREAYGGTADALDTTVLALETLKDTFSTFWEAAKVQFLKAIEAIQKIFRAIVQKFTSVKKRAIALKARVQEDPIDSESESKQVKLNTGNLSIGSANLNETLNIGLKRVYDVLVELLKNTRNVDDRAEVNKGVDSIKEANVWSDYVNGVNNNAKRTFDAIEHSNENTTALLPGSRAITFTQGQAGTRDQFSFETFVNFKSDKEQVNEQEVQALSGKQIIEVCDHIVQISDEIEKYDKVWSRSSSKAARLVQGISAATKGDIAKIEASEPVDEEGKQEKQSKLTAFKINVSALTNHVRRLDKFSSDLITYAQLTSNDALAYGERSLEAIRSNTTTEDTQDK